MRSLRFTCRLLPVGLLALLATPEAAWAHPAATSHSHGLMEGLAHPVFGLDHLLAMAAVGLLAARLGGRALALVPAGFLAAMLLGGGAGMSGFETPAVELMIAASVAVLGLVLVVGRPCSAGLAIALAVLFGLFHGHAHGAEMPAMAQPAAYAFGFLAASALIQIAGVLLGRFVLKATENGARVRIAGAAISAVGLLLVIAAVI